MQPESSFDPSGPTSPVAANAERYQSFGEKAVGLDFNPSGDFNRLYLEVADCRRY